jgi:hypothetical protein
VVDTIGGGGAYESGRQDRCCRENENVPHVASPSR